MLTSVSLPAQAMVEGLYILRDGQVIWEKSFLSGGSANMSHTLFCAILSSITIRPFANFRRPGDIHVHFFGTGTLSFGDGVRTREGDVFEISAPPFTLPVRNPISGARTPDFTIGAV